MGLIRKYWLQLPIQRKTRSYAIALILIMVFVGFFNIYVVNDTVQLMGGMLNDLTRCENVYSAFDAEVSALNRMMRNQNADNRKTYEEACRHMKSSVNQLPFQYDEIGAERYARTWRIISAYAVYEEQRQSVLDADRGTIRTERIYTLIEMQGYLKQYMQELIQITVEENSVIYQQKVPLISRLPFLLIFFSVLAVAITVIFSRVLSKTVTAPVRRIAENARRITAGDFGGEDIQVENTDEIGDLVSAFNQMKQTMSENLELTEQIHRDEMERVEMEKQLETARLDLLQSQINPHFLFNTLNMISGMAELEQADITKRMTGSLAHIFRYNLHTTAQFVSLSQELSVIKDYMYLQHMRFGDRIRFVLKVEKDVDTSMVSVPAFMLQPLAENAVVHGLSGKENGGCLWLRVSHNLGCIEIVIEDDGIGIPIDILESMKLGEKHAPHADHTGIGMRNVYHRVTSLVAGGTMKVESWPGTGTKITISLPEME
ncbi:MAG: sensor histidine kinase [Lachnospiraceae bacterium]|nr:sensor histidine kinase [Lachnospiraceae bacterium]